MARSSKERTEQTRTDLMDAARALFVERGYADTPTPDIVAAAGVTRGALYHHFEDKKALFRAVVQREARLVADEVEAASPVHLGPMDALFKGAEAFISSMQLAGRTRLMLLDGPAVLGRAEMDEIEAANGESSLKSGIAIAVREGAMARDVSIDAATALLSSAFDRAALAIDAGASAAQYKATLERLIRGLAKDAYPTAE